MACAQGLHIDNSPSYTCFTISAALSQLLPHTEARMPTCSTLVFASGQQACSTRHPGPRLVGPALATCRQACERSRISSLPVKISIVGSMMARMTWSDTFNIRMSILSLGIAGATPHMKHEILDRLQKLPAPGVI